MNIFDLLCQLRHTGNILSIAMCVQRTRMRKRREAHRGWYIGRIHRGLHAGRTLWGPQVYFLIERTNPRKGGFIVEVYVIEGVSSPLRMSRREVTSVVSSSSTKNLLGSSASNISRYEMSWSRQFEFLCENLLNSKIEKLWTIKLKFYRAP